MAEDVEKWVELGERVLSAAGGLNALMSNGLDKMLAPSVRRALEKRIAELEAENIYLREALVVLTEDGPLFLDRPKEKVRLDITVDVRHGTLKVGRLEN